MDMKKNKKNKKQKTAHESFVNAGRIRAAAR